jgi:hypothetical protein
MEEGGESDSVNTTDNRSSYSSENTSFNSSSISSYSAEEEIIQQRGRKSPIKQTLIDQHITDNSIVENSAPKSNPPCNCSKSKKTLLRTPVKRRLKLRRDPGKTIRKFRRR